jgi:putative tryptophan/tyrosine transport system substrate-binding protein
VNRRAFIAGLGAAAWPLVARAQQPVIPVIGILSSGLPDTSTPLFQGFWRGLAEAGYEDGRNVVIKYVWGEDKYQQMPTLAADFTANRVAVIVALGNVAARAAKEATTTIPVIFLTGSDPVGIGLVKSLNMPATNMTGIHILNNDLETKRLELLMEIVPQTDVIFLVNPDSPTTEIKLREMRGAVSALNRKLLIFNAKTAADFGAVFAPSPEQSKALVIASDYMFHTHSKELGQLAARQKMPAIAAYRDFATAGGLMSYGTSTTEAYEQVGRYTGRILKGALPADLPVVQSTKVEFVINLKAAKALGLAVSLPLLGRADEVIE